MSGLHWAMVVIGALLALAGLAGALPVAWRHRVREPAGAAGKLERYISYALLTFVAGVALMALPFLLPAPPRGGRAESAQRPAVVPTVPAPLPTGGATTIRPPAQGQTAQAPPSATPAPPPGTVRPTGVPTATTSPPPSSAPSLADISGRWNHANGFVELQEAMPGPQFVFKGFDTQGRLVAEGTAVRSGSSLTLTGVVPGFGLALTGELQVVSGTLIQGALRDPLGNATPIVLTR